MSPKDTDFPSDGWEENRKVLFLELKHLGDAISKLADEVRDFHRANSNKVEKLEKDFQEKLDNLKEVYNKRFEAIALELQATKSKATLLGTLASIVGGLIYAGYKYFSK